MRYRQRGVFLIGATIAVAVVGILITFGLQQYVQSLRNQKAEVVGEALKLIGEGTQSFMVKHHAAIRKAFEDGNAVRLTDAGELQPYGVEVIRSGADPLSLQLRVGARARHITADDIIKIMKLPGVGASPPTMPGASYVVSITREKHARDASIHALVYIDQPLKRTYSAHADMNMLTTAIRKIGVHGGFSSDATPAYITFPQTPAGETDTPNRLANPDANRTPGLLAVRAGYPLGPMSSYLRRDGSDVMTGNLRMGKNDLVSAGNILAGQSQEMTDDVRRQPTKGYVAAEKGIWSYGNLWAKGDIYNDDGNLTIAGTAESKKGNVAASGFVHIGEGDSRAERAAGTITFGTPIVANTSCTSIGQIGRDNLGNFHSCTQKLVWEPLKGKVNSQVTTYEYLNCTTRHLPSKWRHDFCWVSRIDNSPCRQQNNPKVRVYAVSPTVDGSEPYDPATGWNTKSWYKTGNRTFYMLESSESHSVMTCIDFL
ncbi:hypothetical protein [Pandoraea sp. NPDC087047]|uniref:hypothetical protein n=1 Tax=Pandoraea sp. NPDC087047 TaxID=3364390 RepID=UPI00380EC26F